MTTLSHRRRMISHLQSEQQRQIARANAIFNLISALAQARNEIKDQALRSRIERALLEANVALEGFVPIDLPPSVVRLSEAMRA